jgi:hypothetical protein
MGAYYSRHSVFIASCTTTSGSKTEKVYNNWFSKQLPNGYLIGEALEKLLSAQMSVMYDRGPGMQKSFAKYDDKLDDDGLMGGLRVLVPLSTAEIPPVTFLLFGRTFKFTFEKVRLG